MDGQRWLSAKLLPPESSMQHFLLHGQLPRGGEVGDEVEYSEWLGGVGNISHQTGLVWKINRESSCL